MATNREIAVLPVAEERTKALGPNAVAKSRSFVALFINDTVEIGISSARP
jgi:hypothetical protein